MKEVEVLPKVLYSIEAERSTIGAMLLEPYEVIEEVLNFALEEKDFFVPLNRSLFKVLVEMYEESEVMELGLIRQRLEDRGFSKEDSFGTLAEYTANGAMPSLALAYVKIVKEKSVLRTLQDAIVDISRDIKENAENVSGILSRAEAQIFDVAHNSQIQGEPNFGQEIEEAALTIFEHADAGGGLRGLPTGFKEMDNLTTGWNPGELIIIAARPGRGKTGLCLAFIKTLVESQFNVDTGAYDIPGRAIQMFSLEMTRQDLYMRFYAMKAGVGLMNVLTGSISDGDRAKISTAQAEMREWKVFIDDTSRMDIALIRSRARRACRKNKVEAIFVDYLQLAKSRKYPRDRQNEVADISGGLKQIARENNVPVICLAQLNRKDADDEEKEPNVANIRDSGAIEQDADKIILLHEDKNRDTVHKSTESLKHYKAILAKHRNGRMGRIEMDFQAWRVLFTERRDG